MAGPQGSPGLVTEGGAGGAGGGGRWADLVPRLASAVVLLALGAALLLAPQPWMGLLAAALGGVTFWELARMTGRSGPRLAALGGLAAACVLAASIWPVPAAPLLLALPMLAGLKGTAPGHRPAFALFGLAVPLVAYQLIVLREGLGAPFLAWVAGIVILSDTLGYFAGRLIGGPKFWPRISPKKTWSGTVAGWLGAVVWGLGFGLATGQPPLVLALAGLPICLAGQMGDIAESWLKRRAGVKDSSNLIPGHGGVMDRFDALSGAVLAVSALVLCGLIGQGGW